MTTAIGSPLATPTNFAAVFTTIARLYMLRCLCTKALRNTLRCIRAKALRTLLRCLLPKHDAIRCGAHTKALLLYMLRCSQTKATNYAALFITNVLRSTLRCLRANALLHMLRCLTPKLYKDAAASTLRLRKHAAVSTPKLRNAEMSIIVTGRGLDPQDLTLRGLAE